MQLQQQINYLINEVLQMEVDPFILRLSLQPEERLLGEYVAGLLGDLIGAQDDAHLQTSPPSRPSAARARTQREGTPELQLAFIRATTDASPNLPTLFYFSYSLSAISLQITFTPSTTDLKATNKRSTPNMLQYCRDRSFSASERF